MGEREYSNICVGEGYVCVAYVCMCVFVRVCDDPRVCVRSCCELRGMLGVERCRKGPGVCCGSHGLHQKVTEN